TIIETITAYGSVVAQPGDVRILSVPLESRVRKIRVTAGQQVSPDTPVIDVEPSPTELAALAEAKTTLSLAERDLKQVKQRTADRATTQPLDGQIRLIGQRVDPASRLANVIVTLPPDAHLMLETYVAGDIVKSTADALIVPRQAVLPEEGGEHVLYTVK